MSTLIEQLQRQIARLEKERPDSPLLSDLREQLRASKATQGETSQEVYRLQAAPAVATDEEQDKQAEALRRSRVRQLFVGRQGPTPGSSK